MDEEINNLNFLKKALWKDPEDNSLKRAKEYEILRGNRTMFFRNGNGTVFEPMPEINTINSYREEDLKKDLEEFD